MVRRPDLDRCVDDDSTPKLNSNSAKGCVRPVLAGVASSVSHTAVDEFSKIEGFILMCESLACGIIEASWNSRLIGQPRCHVIG